MAVSFGMLGILLMLDVCFIVNFFFVRALRRRTDHAVAKQHVDHTEESEKPQFQLFSRNQQDFAFAWIFGTVRLDPLKVKTFPGWRPLPFRIGILTTCMFVILGTVLLSPEVITSHMTGVSGGSLNANMCVAEDKEEGLDELRSQLLDMTHLEEARRQHRAMVDFHAALVNDTALYGIEPFDCPSKGRVSGKKSDWDQPGPFFPGYCGEALEAAIEAAKERQCTQEVCDCPTLPDTTVFKIAGLADKKFCGEVCISVPYPCPGHTTDQEAEIQDYRYEQYKTAEKQRSRIPYSFPTSVSEDVQSTAMETAEKILRQVDIASYIYIGYSCLAMFFPTPLVLFRMPHWVTLKQFLFGVQKPFFIVSVVAVWWGLEYFENLWLSPDIRLFLNNVRVGDPCFVNTGYLVERQEVLNQVCQDLIPLEPQWNASALTANDVLTEISHFVQDCGCDYPNKHLSNWTANFGSSNLKSIGFNQSFRTCSEGYCFSPSPWPDMDYLGNSTICFNQTEARKLVLEAPHQTETDWHNLLIASGFLATLVVKIAVANFGLSLLSLADPFVICNGQFLCMPHDFGMEVRDHGQRERLDIMTNEALKSDVLYKWFESKHWALFYIGLSKSIFWGFLVHLSLFNLLTSVYDELDPEASLSQTIDNRDMNVLTGCMSLAAFVFLVGIYCIWQLRIPPRSRMEDVLERKRSERQDETGNDTALADEESDLRDDCISPPMFRHQ